ncbi:MAG: hypothetical protein KC503_07005 [Myxococcales bacterium]|nr:hypothetical protein [Myxococcales bacterium]
MTRFKTTFIALCVALAALVSVAGCGTDRAFESRLEVSYVSGHLGTDQGCSSNAKLADIAGACAADVPNCGGYGGCEEGAVTLQLANTGNVTLLGLQLDSLLLQIVGGNQSALSVLDVKRDDGSAFDGKLEPNASIKIRVRFPAPGYQKVPKGATIEAVIVTGGGKQQRVITPELHVLPTVAT